MDDLCDFNDAYVGVTCKVNATNSNLPARGVNNIPTDVVNPKKPALKNSASFFNCSLKISNQLIKDAQDLDIVVPMYNLLKYSKKFRKTT